MKLLSKGYWWLPLSDEESSPSIEEGQSPEERSVDVLE